MKKIIYSSIIAGMAIVLSTVVSCKKNNLDLDENDKTIAEESMVGNQVSSDIGDIVDEAIFDSTSSGMRTAASCAPMVRSYRNDSTFIEINFNNTTCLDGRTRSGIIRIRFRGSSRNGLPSASITFIDFKSDGNTINGYGSIRPYDRRGRLRNSRVYLNYSITSGTLSSSVIFSSKIKFDRDAKSFTIDSLSSVNKAFSGTGYKLLVTKSIVKKADCKFIGAGEIQLTKDGDTEPRILNFGDGTCDNKATVTLGSITKEITMK